MSKGPLRGTLQAGIGYSSQGEQEIGQDEGRGQTDTIVLMKASNTFQVYFDGGTNGRNGFNQDGYGSWQVDFNGFSKKVLRQQFLAVGVCHVVSSNVAEWLALKCALMWLESVKHKNNYSVAIFGDSQLVLNQLAGVWKTKNKNMAELKEGCLYCLLGFDSWTTYWQRRDANVARFGH